MRICLDFAEHIQAKTEYFVESQCWMSFMLHIQYGTKQLPALDICCPGAAHELAAWLVSKLEPIVLFYLTCDYKIFYHVPFKSSVPFS